jgi:hypothetical protein
VHFQIRGKSILGRIPATRGRAIRYNLLSPNGAKSIFASIPCAANRRLRPLYLMGKAFSVGGTSADAPALAAMLLTARSAVRAVSERPFLTKSKAETACVGVTARFTVKASLSACFGCCATPCSATGTHSLFTRSLSLSKGGNRHSLALAKSAAFRHEPGEGFLGQRTGGQSRSAAQARTRQRSPTYTTPRAFTDKLTRCCHPRSRALSIEITLYRQSN